MVDTHYPDQLLERVEQLRVASNSGTEVAMPRERLLLVGNIPHLHISHQDLEQRCSDISRLAHGLEQSGKYEVVVAGSRKQAQEMYHTSKVHGRYGRIVITLPDNPEGFLHGAELLETAADLRKEDPNIHVTVVVGKDAMNDYRPRLERERVHYTSGRPEGTINAFYDRESLLAVLEEKPMSQQEVNHVVQLAKEARARQTGTGA
ncbi:hypothetical protein HYS47_01125 [Candidatus Woesearchaeota archaeon]|nr:hypothetical protein [Candidatus Woesearchaeota archaeon]